MLVAVSSQCQGFPMLAGKNKVESPFVFFCGQVRGPGEASTRALIYGEPTSRVGWGGANLCSSSTAFVSLGD